MAPVQNAEYPILYTIYSILVLRANTIYSARCAIKSNLHSNHKLLKTHILYVSPIDIRILHVYDMIIRYKGERIVAKVSEIVKKIKRNGCYKIREG